MGKYQAITLKPIILELDSETPMMTRVIGIPANCKVEIKFLDNGLSNSEDIQEVIKLLEMSGLPGEMIYGRVKQ